MTAQLPAPLEHLDNFELRQQQIEDSGEFGATYSVDGVLHSYAALAPVALEAQEQLELELSGYSLRESIRRALADKIEFEVLPICAEADRFGEMPTKLRTARQAGKLGIRLRDGKRMFCWDSKAGLSRLCPDDAREEAMRLRRRVMPTALKLREEGHRFLWCVLTVPNSAAGELRKGMGAVFDRFKHLLKSKNKLGEKKFPQIKGALAVLEAPLGQSRDWNVHLNVLLPCKGFLNFAELREHWHWNLECKWLPNAPGAFEAAFAELIKYPVVATVAKSAEHAAAGKTRAPPMLEWRPGELLEWLRAMKGFRRTRAYGALYGATAAEAEDMGPVLWIGRVELLRGRYIARIPLLGSIPEDKFSGRTHAERWESLKRALAPGGLAGAGELGASIPRDALLTLEKQHNKK